MATRCAPNKPCSALPDSLRTTPHRFCSSGELLQEDGQHEKAERVLSKAQALGGSQRDSFVEAPETADDLIAFAEQQERKTHVGLTPKQILLGAVALILAGAVVGGIAVITGSNVEEPSGGAGAGAGRGHRARAGA